MTVVQVQAKAYHHATSLLNQSEAAVDRAGLYDSHAKIVEVEIGGVTIYRVEVQLVSGSGNFPFFLSGRTRQQQQHNCIYHVTLTSHELLNRLAGNTWMSLSCDYDVT
ncbi:hypothetical protein TNCV_1409041 [Trichonephila clavipes]|uniref:Uncharacterized protein n=1 Tax=Trichonephila clavipes TaxID=2585209 RepID=A0A8X6R6G7_TRICX|nr:hypothetical protein TNCV_1409041 [Trichonephila clavipes]